jgi:hypothetical protein
MTVHLTEGALLGRESLALLNATKADTRARRFAAAAPEVSGRERCCVTVGGMHDMTFLGPPR